MRSVDLLCLSDHNFEFNALFSPSWNTDQGVWVACKCCRSLKAHTRNESEKCDLYGWHYFVVRAPKWCLATTDGFAINAWLIQSKQHTTRKMVIYAWAGRSHGKPWWKPEAVLTCKSIVWPKHRGENKSNHLVAGFLRSFPQDSKSLSKIEKSSLCNFIG